MSMPPYLRERRPAGGGSVEYRKPDDKESKLSDIEVCGQDLLRAIEEKNFKGIASALKAAFDICYSDPSLEESYEDKTE